MFSEQTEERKYRYVLLERALELYKEFKVVDRVKGLASCSRFAPLGGFSVNVRPDGSLVVCGLNKCHSRSSCPVCSLPSQKKSLDEIRWGIWSARKKGFFPYLVTYNFQHGLADELVVIQSAFSMAREKMYRDGSFRRLMASLDYKGRITDYEVQLCGHNGYHPHSHELEFFGCEVDQEWLRDEYASYYLDALESVGLSARDDVAVNIVGYKGVGDYITKLSEEMTLHLFSKESWGGGSLSPMKCLSMYNETGDKWFGVWFVDYVISVKRKRFLGWSRGLRDLLNVRSLIKEEGGEEMGDLSEPLFYVDRENMSRLTPAEWRGIVNELDVLNVSEVEDFLKSVRISYRVLGDGLEMLESRI